MVRHRARAPAASFRRRAALAFGVPCRHPQIARYAFDLGNLSFANGWVATGALAICAGSILITHRALPSWLGWWAIVAGVGSVLARAVWTEGYAMAPVAAFWVWVAVLSVWLIRGRLDARSTV